MQTDDIDVLVVTHRCPRRAELTLSRLLEIPNVNLRLWLWHNGEHEETLNLVRGFANHPRVHRFHHSIENKKLWEPTNWLFENAEGQFLSKIDDDNIVGLDWPSTLIDAHRANENFGVIGCWRFQEEDFVPELAEKKISSFRGGHSLMRNLWVEGSCFLMKRKCVEDLGPLKPGQSFSLYCRELAQKGWINGWYYPFITYENLDDPRAPHTLIQSDADLLDRLPLTAQYNEIVTLDQWVEQLKRSARSVQASSADPRDWRGWRFFVKRVRARLRRMLGDKRRW